jgi:glycosyltransferase involved in cell wall biosynthesis
MTTQPQIGERPVRVLMVTGAYPSLERPHWGTFIKSQVDSLRDDGVQVDVIRPAPGPMPVRYLRAAVGVLAGSLSGRYDLVHGHYGLWGLVARLQWRLPVVVSFLGDDVLGTPLDVGVYTPKSRLVARISKWLSLHVDAVIVKSREMAAALPRSDVDVIPNGVDFSVFRPLSRSEARKALGWDPTRSYVLFGNDPSIPRKGYPLAQQVIGLLRERGHEVELVVANGLPHETVPLYLNASDALLLPSILEGSPNIVKEAMACNLPVVATDVGDVAEVVGGTAGCAVCPRDPQALAEALERALRHPGPTTGRADIAQLERGAVAARVLAVYNRVLARVPRLEALAV